MSEFFRPPQEQKDAIDEFLEKPHAVEKFPEKRDQVQLFQGDIRKVLSLFVAVGHDPEQFAHALAVQRLFPFIETFATRSGHDYVVAELSKHGLSEEDFTAAFVAAERKMGVDRDRFQEAISLVGEIVSASKSVDSDERRLEKLRKQLDFLEQTPYWNSKGYELLATLTDWQKGMPKDISRRAGEKLAELVGQYPSLDDFLAVLEQGRRFDNGGASAFDTPDEASKYAERVEKDSGRVLREVARAISREAPYDDYRRLMQQLPSFLDRHPSSELAQKAVFLSTALKDAPGQDDDYHLFLNVLQKSPPITDAILSQGVSDAFLRSDMRVLDVLKNINTALAIKGAGNVRLEDLHLLGNFSNWSRNGYSDTLGLYQRNVLVRYVGECVQRTVDLEAWKKGSSDVLTDYFKIRNFGRYPLDILKHQYDHRDDIDMLYGQVVFGDDDNNNAFSSEKSQSLLTSMFQQLEKQGAGMRIIEIESARDYLKQLRRMNVRYGEKNKPAFVVVETHGAKNAMHFGRLTAQAIKRWSDYVESPVLKNGFDELQNDFNKNFREFKEFTEILRQLVVGDKVVNTVAGDHGPGMLTQRQIERPGMQVVKKSLAPKAPVLLVSCATGAENGMAQSLSKSLDTETIAPATSTESPENVIITVHTDRTIGFSSVTYPEVKTKIYQSGVLKK